MKEFYLELHSNNCACNNKVEGEFSFLSNFCELNPERFLFFLANDFHVLTYHGCIAGDEYEFKKSVIEKYTKSCKIYELYKVNRGVDVKYDLKEFRLRNTSLRKYVQQVNCIYSNMVGKEYAITTTVKYIDAISNFDSFEANYIKAKKILEERNDEYLIKQLDQLYIQNSRIFFDSEVEIVKTTEHLITKINQMSHGNY